MTHVLMVNGFDLDVDLEETGHFDALRAIYGPMASKLGLELVRERKDNGRAAATVSAEDFERLVAYFAARRQQALATRRAERAAARRKAS